MAVAPLLPRSLRFRMTGVVILLVLAATITVTWAALVLAERDMKSIIGNQQFALLSSVAAQVDARIGARRMLLASVADFIPADAGSDPAHMQAFVARHPSVQREFEYLYIYDRRGVLTYTNGNGAAVLQPNVRQREVMESALSANQAIVSPPFKSTLSGEPTIVILQPAAPGADGKPRILLGGSINLTSSPFLAQIAEQKPGKTGFLFIMTSKGVLVHHPNPARLLENINARPGYNRATEMALQGFEGWTEAANKDGNVGIYSYKHLQSTDWIIGARYPVDEAFAPMIEMRRHAILAAAAFAAVAGLLAWAAIQILLKPLAQLRHHIVDIRRGAAEISVLQRRRPDEIGELGSAFHALMAEREAAQKRAHMIADNLPVLIAYLDRERKFQFVNATFRHWFGIEPEAMLGRHLVEGIGPEHYNSADTHLTQAYKGNVVICELVASISGSPRTLETTFVPEFDDDGKVVGIYSLTHDTTRIKEIEQRLTQLARVDTLTGISNRLMFEETLPQAILRTRRNRKPLALAYLDVDHFKAINDTRGHGAGDAVLREFAIRLLRCVRASDTVARLAGDEFVIIFEQVASLEETEKMAAKIIESIRRPFELEEAVLKISTSIGLALHRTDETPAELVARADAALYQAKRKGRDGYVID